MHRERYSAEHLDEALEANDRATIARGIYRGRHVPAGGDPELDADDEDHYGWCEHTARRCSNPGHLGAASLRRHLREQVRRSGAPRCSTAPGGDAAPGAVRTTSRR